MADQALSIFDEIDQQLAKDKGTAPNIVQVQYYSESTGEYSKRAYSYYSIDQLAVGDIVIVPVAERTAKAKVIAIDIPQDTVVKFQHLMKTIPAGSLLKEEVLQPIKVSERDRELAEGRERVRGEILAGGLAAAAQAAGAEVTAVEAEVLKPGEDMEVRGYHIQAVKLLDYAESRIIASLEDNKAANDDLAIISKLKKVMEDKKKEYLVPLKAQTDAIRDTYNYLMGPVLEADKITRAKMAAWDAEQRRRRAEQEDINRLKMEAARKEAELSGTGEITESVELVGVIPEQRPVVTDQATTSMTSHWTYEVVDFALVPDAYKVIDKAQLSTIARSHHDQKPIPGVRFFNNPSITVRA